MPRELPGCAARLLRPGRPLHDPHPQRHPGLGRCRQRRPRHGGLTRFGEEVVREMNRLGMLVDFSHVSPDVDGRRAAGERSAGDLLALVVPGRSATCHATSRTPCSPGFPKNGGVVMITFVASFLSQEVATLRAPRPARGVDRTGQGPPRSGSASSANTSPKNPWPGHRSRRRPTTSTTRAARRSRPRRPGRRLRRQRRWPEGLEDVTAYPRLFAELIRRGWTDADLEKLSQGNVLRALEGAEAASLRLRAARPASTATLESLDGSTQP